MFTYFFTYFTYFKTLLLYTTPSCHKLVTSLGFFHHVMELAYPHMNRVTKRLTRWLFCYSDTRRIPSVPFDLQQWQMVYISSTGLGLGKFLTCVCVCACVCVRACVPGGPGGAEPQPHRGAMAQEVPRAPVLEERRGGRGQRLWRGAKGPLPQGLYPLPP